MFKIIFFVVVGVLFVSWVIDRYVSYQKLNSLFEVDEVLKLETVILFSNEELARRILKIIKRTGKPLKVELADNYSFIVPVDISKKELLDKFELAQSLMIEKRYDGRDEITVKECVDKKIFDTWLDYGYKQNYRVILKREMLSMFETGEISNSTYNEMYRRAYLFERDKYAKGGLYKL